MLSSCRQHFLICRRSKLLINNKKILVIIHFLHIEKKIKIETKTLTRTYAISSKVRSTETSMYMPTNSANSHTSLRKKQKLKNLEMPELSWKQHYGIRGTSRYFKIGKSTKNAKNLEGKYSQNYLKNCFFTCVKSTAPGVECVLITSDY